MRSNVMHTDLHRRERYRGPVGVRRVVREVGAALPGGIRLWDNGWSEFIPLQGSTTWRYGGSSCSTNAIESLNARYRRAIKAVGTSRRQAAFKCSYLVTRSLDPTGVGKARWTMRWKPALNAFAITFGDRFPAAEAYS